MSPGGSSIWALRASFLPMTISLQGTSLMKERIYWRPYNVVEVQFFITLDMHTFLKYIETGNWQALHRREDLRPQLAVIDSLSPEFQSQNFSVQSQNLSKTMYFTISHFQPPSTAPRSWKSRLKSTITNRRAIDWKKRVGVFQKWYGVVVLRLFHLIPLRFTSEGVALDPRDQLYPGDSFSFTSWIPSADHNETHETAMISNSNPGLFYTNAVNLSGKISGEEQFQQLVCPLHTVSACN